MTQFTELELQILSYYQIKKWRVGNIASQLRVHHSVVRRVLAQAGLLVLESPSGRSTANSYLPFIRQTLENFPTLPASRIYRLIVERGYAGGPDHIRHLMACLRPRFDPSEWMLALLQKRIDVEDLKQQTDNLSEIEAFLDRLYNGKLSDRNKSLAILAYRRGLTICTTCVFLGISSNTYWRYKRIFLNGGTEALFARKSHPTRKRDGDVLKSTIFKILHEPPSNYGINRITWTMPLFRKVLAETGSGACPEVIRRITRAAGYRWRKARVVLTSADPTYTEKLDRIHSILSNLRPDEMFFSIDEYGPFAIKMHGGRKLMGPSLENSPGWLRSFGPMTLAQPEAVWP